MKLKDSTQKIENILAKGEDMTKSDIQYLLNKEVTQDRIGKALGTDRNGFQRMWKDWNNAKNKKPQTDKEANKEAKRLVEEGELSIREISNLTGAKFSTVAHYARGRGVKKMKSRVDLQKFDELKKQGKKMKDIAEYFGLTESNLHYHLKKARQEQKEGSSQEEVEEQIESEQPPAKQVSKEEMKLKAQNRKLKEEKQQLKDLLEKKNEEPNSEVHQRTIKRLEETNSTLVQKNKTLQEKVDSVTKENHKYYDDMWKVQLELEEADKEIRALKKQIEQEQEKSTVYSKALKLSI